MTIGKIGDRYVILCDKCGDPMPGRYESADKARLMLREYGWNHYNYGVETFVCKKCRDKARQGLLGVIINETEKIVGGAENRRILWGFWFGDGKPMSTKKLTNEQIDYLLGIASPEKNKLTDKWIVTETYERVVRSKWTEYIASLPFAGSLLDDAQQLGGVVVDASARARPHSIQSNMSIIDRIKKAHGK